MNEEVRKFAVLFLYEKFSKALTLLKIVATPEEFEAMRETLTKINNRLSKECE
jgi:hypothetical protein